MKNFLHPETGEEIIYIEYDNGIPMTVITCDVGREYGQSNYDFGFVDGCKTDIRWYAAGSGGSRKAIQAPHFVDRRGKRYWMASDAKFQGRSKAINCKRIKYPLQVRGWRRKSINPFKVADETSYGFEWCKVCKQHSADGEGCSDHQHWSDAQCCLVYNKDGSRVE